jgi:hypothetical protein
LSLLILAPGLSARSNPDASAFVVSLYQLEHKPCKEAKHLADKGFDMLKNTTIKPRLNSSTKPIR